ncbi:MAG: glycine zipper 2TM domain-containing protein [Rhodospirillales bacterium]|nr:glycine zipper 2TM domain-containing protein [Rhodospirillales bacterium]
MKTKIIALVTAALVSVGASANTAQAADYRDGSSIFGTILGGAIGGVIGSKIGKGDGRLVATAAGAVIGATVGHTMATTPREPYPTHRVHVGDDDDYFSDDDYYDDPPKVVYRPVTKTVVKKVIIEQPVVERKVVVIKKYPAKQYGYKHDRRWKRNQHNHKVVWNNRGQARKICKTNGRHCRWVM